MGFGPSAFSMETSIVINSIRPALAAPDGTRIATLTSTSLEIRDSLSLDIVRTIQYHSNSKLVCIRWAPPQKGSGVSNRVLIANEDRVHIWDIQDEEWAATIDNGTGGTGKIANVEFGCDDTEVLVFASFGSRVTIWSLWTGKSIEIRDPKFATRGYSRSRAGRSSVLALLSRPSTQDVITLHAAQTYEVIKSFTLPTVDAQGLRWSPDGRFLAVWDTCSMGYKVLIYTCDGHLFRRFTGDCFEESVAGLGVKSIEWSPSGDTLLVCGYEKTVALLTTRTFSPAVTITHAPIVRLAASNYIWQEHARSATDRSYAQASQPYSPPTAAPDTAAEAKCRVGVSILAFNKDGSLLVTKDDSMPTTVWVWDLLGLKLRAVLVQHSIVKRASWHPTDPDLLMVQCQQDESILYLWSNSTNSAQVLSMQAGLVPGKADAEWLATSSSRPSAILVKDSTKFLLAYPSGKPTFADRLAGYQDAAFMSSASEAGTIDGNESDDSLDAILSGKKKHRLDPDYRADIDGTPERDLHLMDDTFRNLKVGKAY